MRLAPPTVHDVAIHLASPAGESELTKWQSLVDARCRSARSRAYYSVFLAMKNRVLLQRPGFDFPSRDAHATILGAVGSFYAQTHRFTIVLKGLLGLRKKADYELDGPADPEAGMQSSLLNAKFALEAIAGWAPQQVEQLIAGIEKHRRRT